MRRFVLPLVVLAVVPVLARADAPDRAILEKLNATKVELKFENAEFAAVVAHLRDATGLNLMVDAKAQEAVQNHPVTLRLTGLSAASALRWLLAAQDLTWKVAEGVIWITTREAAVEPHELRLYDVTDIVSQPRDFPPEGEVQAQGMTAEDLAQLIKNVVARGTWETPPNSIEAAHNTLIVQTEPRVLAQVERLCAALRALARLTVTFDARVVDLARDALPGAPALGSLVPGKVVLTRAEAAALLAKTDGSAQVVEAARFTCMNGQRTHLRLGRDDGEALGVLSREAAAAGLVKVQVEERATVLEVSPILVVGRDQVLVDLRATLADPPRGPEVLEVPDGRIECARSGERRLRTSIQVPNGGGCLFVLGPAGDHVRALLLRVSSAAPAVPTSVPIESVPAEDAAAAAAASAFLARKVSLDFQDKPVREIVADLQAMGGMNCLLDPALADDEIAGRKVTLKLRELEMRSALSLLTHMLDLVWVFRDEALVFTRANRAESPRVEVYDVRDLLWRKLDWTALTPQPETELAAARLLPEGDDSQPFEAEALENLVKHNIAPASWEESPEEVGLTLFHGAMVVQQRPSVHKLLAQFLEQLRAAKPRLVQVDVRVLDVEGAVADGLDAGGDDALPAAARAALEKALADGHASVEAAWSIAGLNAQRFHLLDWNRRRFVSGYDLAKTADPVYQTLVGGHLLEVRPTLVSTEPGRLLVELRVACSTVPDALRSERVGAVAVQVPSASRGLVNTSVAAASGETRLFALGNVTGAGGTLRRVLVWTVKVVE